MSAGKVLLTGASAGIGLATAQLLTKNGYEVWGTSRSIQRLPELRRFHPVALDLNQKDSIKKAFDQIIHEAHGIDILINNAGNGFFGSIEETPEAIFKDQFQTLVFGPVYLMQLALTVMRKQDHGRIINVSSLAADLPIPFLGVYSAAKAAMASITRTARLELAQSKIQIIDLQPGDINTPFHDSMQTVNTTESSPYIALQAEVYRQIEKTMRSSPSPEIVAQVILKILKTHFYKPVVRAGHPFQAIVAPLADRLISTRWMDHILRMYYKIEG